MPLSLRDLLLMADAKRRETWEHTSSVLCLIANVNSKKRKYKPNDFNPYKSSVKSDRMANAIPINDISILKDIFVDGNMKEVQRKVNIAVDEFQKNLKAENEV